MRTPFSRHNSFFEEMKTSFGEEVYEILILYADTITLLAKTIPRKVFLQRCKREEIIPRFIMDKNTVFESLYDQLENDGFVQQINNLKHNFQIKFLNIEISICFDKLKKLYQKSDDLRFQLFRRIPFEILDRFLYTQDQKFDRIFQNDSKGLIKKFDALLLAQGVINDIAYDESCFVNLTDVHFPLETRVLLSFGPKFSIPFEKRCELPIFDILGEIEDLIRTNFDEDDRRFARHKTIECLNSCLNEDFKLNRVERFLLSGLRKTRSFIKRHSDIIVVNSDKSNKTIVMYQRDYDSKVTDLLSDSTTYDVIPCDPTKNLVKTCKSILDDVCQIGYINQETKDSLTQVDPIPPRIYVVLKLHKENSPGRPIVSSIGSIGQPIAKYLCKILDNVSDRMNYNVKNSFDFKTFVDSIQIPDSSLELVSFDVKSLFTNVPLDLVFQIIDEKWSEIKLYTRLPKKWFIRLLTFCIVDCNYFIFKDNFYKQKEGLAMGSSLSPILSDLVLEKLFNSQIPKFSSEPPFFKKYVDDIICMIPRRYIMQTLEILNDFHPKLQFTVETEKNNLINFLDMTLIHDHDKITTNFYRKSTSSDRILNYLSKHPFHMRYNTAISFARRVKILSDPCFLRSNADMIQKILLANNYPVKTIRKVIKSYRYFQPTVDGSSSMKGDNKFSCLTYIEGLTDKLTKKISVMNSEIKYGYRISNKTSKLFTNTESRIDVNEIRGVVYKINCLGTNGMSCNGVYIGETSRKLN
jgi:Reverse transcriptase (RNA-dependent DNA polymerase)